MSNKLSLNVETIRTLVSSELDLVLGGAAAEPTSSAIHTHKVSSALKPTGTAVSSAHHPVHATVAKPTHTAVSSAMNPTATAVSSARW
jgi:hypothetical protein